MKRRRCGADRLGLAPVLCGDNGGEETGKAGAARMGKRSGGKVPAACLHVPAEIQTHHPRQPHRLHQPLTPLPACAHAQRPTPPSAQAATALLTQQAGLRVLPCEALDGRSAGRVLDAVLDCMRSGRAPSPTTATSATASTAMPSFASGRASLARGPIAASTAAAGIGAGARTGAAAGPSPPDLRLVLIAGLPNTGKSSLINALRRAAAARGE